MPTSALIKVTGPSPFEISVSHDGIPSLILKTLDSTSVRPGYLTANSFESAYMAQYDHFETQGLISVSTEPKDSHDWEYHINRKGQISIYCNQSWSPVDATQAVSPLHQLQVVKNERKPAITQDLILSVKGLYEKGYQINHSDNLELVIAPSEVHFLTNNCLEDCEFLDEDFFIEMGLEYDNSDGFYPLTKHEQTLVAEDFGMFNHTFGGTLGATCLYNGKKHLCSEVQFYFDNHVSDEMNHDEAAQAYSHTLTDMVQIASTLDGFVMWQNAISFEHPTLSALKPVTKGEYTAWVLIPFDAIECISTDRNTFKAFLAMADYKDPDCIPKTLSRISAINEVAKIDEYLFLHDRGYKLTEINKETILFNRIEAANGQSLSFNIYYHTKTGTYTAKITSIDDDNANKPEDCSFSETESVSGIYSTIENHAFRN